MRIEEAEGIPIGKVVGVHGVKGNLKVYSYAESVSIFETRAQIFIGTEEGAGKHFTIQWVKPHKRVFLFCLEGVESREQAESLIGLELFIEKTALPDTEDGEFYWFDIIGLSVFETDGNFLGVVDSIMRTGSNDVYVVKDRDSEILVPAIEAVVVEIDLEKKIMRVDLPEGL
jgi:16S rRNA processing protein RimM